jgi:hypothetical protein
MRVDRVGSVLACVVWVAACSRESEDQGVDAGTDLGGFWFFLYRDVGAAPELPAPDRVDAPPAVDLVATGDLDSDGALDAVTTSAAGIGVVLDVEVAARVLGDVFPDETIPVALRVADLDGDGRLDVVVCGGAHRLSVFAGQGDGTFAEPVELLEREPASAESYLWSDMRVGRLDGDDLLDLVLAGEEVQVWRGDGLLGFDPSSTAEPAAPNASHRAVWLDDLDGDGATDVLAHAWLTGWRVGDDHDDWISAHLGDGRGGLGPELRSDLAGVTNAVAVSGDVADLDGDGAADVVWFEETRERLGIARGTGDGSFRAAETLASSDLRWHEGIDPIDVTGDGIVDLVGFDFESVWYLPGLGEGRFDAPRVARVPALATAMTVADVDGNGSLDFLVAAGIDADSGD